MELCTSVLNLFFSRVRFFSLKTFSQIVSIVLNYPLRLRLILKRPRCRLGSSADCSINHRKLKFLLQKKFKVFETKPHLSGSLDHTHRVGQILVKLSLSPHRITFSWDLFLTLYIIFYGVITQRPYYFYLISIMS